MNNYYHNQRTITSLKSLIDEVVISNSDYIATNRNNAIDTIVNFLQSKIIEVLPQAIQNVKINKALSPLQLKIRELRSQRRGGLHKYNKNNNYFPDEIIRATKASLFPHYVAASSIETHYNIGFKNSTKTLIKDTDILNDQFTDKENLKPNLRNDTSDKQFKKSITGTISKKSTTDNKNTIYKLAPTLQSFTKTSAIGKKFLSSIEKLIKISPNEDIIHYYVDLKERPDLNFIIKIKIKPLISNKMEVINEYNNKFLKCLLEDSKTLELIEKKEFEKLISKLYIIPDDNSKNKIEHFKKVEDRHLNLDDITQMYNFFRITNDEAQLHKLYSILQKNLNKRNRENKINCLEELDSIHKMLDDDFLFNKYSYNDMYTKIEKLLRALLLDEYNILCQRESNLFLEGKITFEQYEKNIDEYMSNVLQLC